MRRCFSVGCDFVGWMSLYALDVDGHRLVVCELWEQEMLMLAGPNPRPGPLAMAQLGLACCDIQLSWAELCRKVWLDQFVDFYAEMTSLAKGANRSIHGGGQSIVKIDEVVWSGHEYL